ncbi:MAG: hypothetical protein LBT59_07245 [Clostridiales bacterium]|jgi:hypothetical protein|nr:hypothetical protein [Clostridiales bacterium]
MRELLRRIDIEKLYDFLEERLKNDKSLSKMFLATFAEPDYDSVLRSLKKDIEYAIHNTELHKENYGTIDIDTDKVTKEIIAYADNGHVRLAFSALEIMYKKLVEVIEELRDCDIPEALFSCVDLISDIASDAKDPKDIEYLFEGCLKLAKAEIDYDYELDFPEEFWHICSRLVTEENRAKLEEEADNMPSSAYIEIIRKLDGQQAVDDYILARADDPIFRRMAYDEAMAKKDYVAAEHWINIFLESDNQYGRLRAYPKIISEVPEKSGVEAFARTFPAPIRNFGICT